MRALVEAREMRGIKIGPELPNFHEMRRAESRLFDVRIEEVFCKSHSTIKNFSMKKNNRDSSDQEYVMA